MTVKVTVEGRVSDGWEEWTTRSEEFEFETDEEAVAAANKLTDEWERTGMFDYARWDYS